ncbi:MAG: TIGR00725 family protein [Desulfobacteraceae bacterium]|jgi:hypothetical protein
MQKSLSQQQIVIGVMGGANVSTMDEEKAYQLGKLIAKNGWVLLNGGRNRGVMHASAKGAVEHGGLTVGILPDDCTDNMSEFIKIPIITGIGSARNCINVLSSQVVVACYGGAGTLSEIALALKHHKRVILMGMKVATLFEDYRLKGYLSHAQTPQEVILQIKAALTHKDY